MLFVAFRNQVIFSKKIVIMSSDRQRILTWVSR